MKNILMSLLVAVAMLGLLANAEAATTNKPVTKAAPAKTKAKTHPFKGIIKTLDQTAKLVVLEGPKAQTYLITSETRITKNGKPAVLADIIVGEEVTGQARETPEGKWEARSIYAGKKAKN